MGWGLSLGKGVPKRGQEEELTRNIAGDFFEEGEI